MIWKLPRGCVWVGFMQNEGSYQSWLDAVQDISLSFNSAGIFPFRLEVIHSPHLLHYYSRRVPGKGLSRLVTGWLDSDEYAFCTSIWNPLSEFGKRLGLEDCKSEMLQSGNFFIIHLHASHRPHASLTGLFPISDCELHETGMALPSARTSTFP